MMGRVNHMTRRFGLGLSLLFVGCGQSSPQPIPVQVPGAPIAAVPGQVPGFPIAPGQPVVPGQPFPGVGIAPAIPTVLPPGPTAIPLTPTTPGTALVPGQVGSAPVAPTIPPPPPGADPRAADRMREYTVEMIARGFSPHGTPGADTLSTNQSDNFAITLNGGDCYRVAGFGGAGVRDLDAYLYDPSGRQM